MRYVSVFSGIEAASVAWGPLGWHPVCFCEVDEFPKAVLRHRFPSVPNLGDITKVDWRSLAKCAGRPDAVVGGSPCQSFSVAGARTGLEGESGLMWEYVRAVRELMPRWLLWENVPGALSSSHGEDFRCLLEALDALGYGLAWRVLDAQFFGVAQRRERVFVVGRLGDVEGPCKVLFEPESLSWDSPSSREKRKELAAGAGGGAACAGFRWNAGGKTALSVGETSPTIVSSEPPAVCAGFKRHQGSGAGSIAVLTPWDVQSKRIYASDGVAPTLQAGGGRGASVQPIVFGIAGNIENRKPGNGGNGSGWCNPDENGMYTLTATDRHAVCMTDTQDGYVLRRLTPLECERLQGFPDGWTDVEYCGKPAPDTKRYKAIGNSMAVPVMRWIGERMQKAEEELREA